MLKRVALIASGWMFLGMGAAGLFLPVLPGILFLLIGLSILSVEYEWARRWVSSLGRRFPAADRKLQSMLGKKMAKPTSA
ncbi:MAG TPA: PGPGW domain-containing protein [Candidatus Sulfotelmatobacter sp.]|nr:PGPGW domain-containing protein [Candidatus Sulfotelmatobacter sp.]